MKQLRARISIALGCLLLGLPVGILAGPSPAEIARERGVNSMAAGLPHTLESGDLPGFIRTMSLTEMAKRAVEGMKVSDQARASIVNDLEKVYFKSYEEYFKSFDDFELVNVKRVSGSPVITIRMVQDDTFFDYLHLTVGFLENGEGRIVDVMDRLEGEALSERLRRAAGTIMVQRGAADGALKAQWGEWAEYGSDVHKITKMARLGEHTQVLELQKRLPPALLNYKAMQVLRVLAILNLEPKKFPEIARDFEKRFPGDPTSAMFNYYAAQTGSDLALTLASIDKLETTFGDTNYCNFLRANQYIEANQLQKALDIAQPMISKYRSYDRITHICIYLYAQLKKYDELGKLLRELERDTEREMYAFVREDEAIKPFLRSEAGKKWLNSPVKLPLSAPHAAEIKAILSSAPSAAPAAPKAVATKAPAATAAPAKPAEPAPRFQLKAILFSKKSPSALINGKSVFIGEKVDGAIVTKIDETTVTLEVDGKTEVLKLP